MPFPKLFGRLADEFIQKYKLDERRYMNALAKISVFNYDNAKRNPMSQTRKWFMDYEEASHRGSKTNKLVSKRLAVSDCSQVTDGAAVVVLASESYMKEHKEFINAPIVKGFGHRVAPMLFSKKMTESKKSQYVLPWTKQAVDDCYKRACMSVEEIDCFEAHDCFTSSEYAVISAFGLTKPGREYEAIESGLIAFEGKNLLIQVVDNRLWSSCWASGIRMFLDIYKQVSGNAGEYQVQNARNAMMLNIGGSATTNYAFIVGCDT